MAAGLGWLGPLSLVGMLLLVTSPIQPPEMGTRSSVGPIATAPAIHIGEPALDTGASVSALHLPRADEIADGIIAASGHGGRISPQATEPFRWANLTDFASPLPPARFPMDLSYDSELGKVVLAGGFGVESGAFGVLQDTWTYDNGSWTNVTASVGNLSADTEGVMAYDPQGKDELLFGGFSSIGSRDGNDTWALVDGRWSNITQNLSISPPATDSSLAQMAYDPGLGKIILLEIPARYSSTGVSEFYKGPALTWSFSNGTWANITAGSASPPPGTIETSLAYDSQDGYLVAFGGLVPASGLNDSSPGTWIFGSAGWAQRTTLSPTPSPRYGAVLAEDPQVGGLVLFGGMANASGGTNLSSPEPVTDTWEFHAGNWSNLTGSVGSLAPPEGLAGALVWDPAAQYLVYLSTGASFTPEQWTLGNLTPLASVRLNPSAVEENESYQIEVRTAAAIDPVTFVFWETPPGCPAADLQNLTCTATTPGTFPIVVSIIDASGFESPNTTGSLVVRPSVSLTQLNAPIEAHLGVAFNVSADASGGFPPYTFAYPTVPTGCNPGNGTLFSCVVSVAGSYSIDVLVQDTRGFTSSKSETILVAPLPGIPRLTVSRPFADVGEALWFNLTVTGGAPPLSASYVGLPVGCASANTFQLTCSPSSSGSVEVTAQVRDGLGSVAASTPELVVVAPVLSIADLLVSPRTIAVGENVTFNLTMIGGTGPLSITWDGLPAGCDSAGAHFVCVPAESGTYQVSVRITDAAGVTVEGTSALNVTNAPSEPAASQTVWWVAIAGGSAALAMGIALVLRRSRRTDVERPQGPTN